MFTGIITDVGHIVSVTTGRDARTFTLESAYDAAGIAIGASISHAGCCLTVVDRGTREGGQKGAWHTVEASNETLSKTTLGAWEEGGRVNLERALAAGDELGGHIVSGHVDGLGALVDKSQDAGSWRLVFSAPPDLAPALAPKGSIAIDGVSLTVNEVQDQSSGAAHFGVNIIPHTWQETTLGTLKVGQPVNLEIDMLARYVARLVEAKGLVP